MTVPLAQPLPGLPISTVTGSCPLCGLPGPRHEQLLHRIAAARTPLCGCDPDEHDGTGPCILSAGHIGICVGLALTADDSPSGGPVVFACRADDNARHPLVG